LEVPILEQVIKRNSNYEEGNGNRGEFDCFIPQGLQGMVAKGHMDDFDPYLNTKIVMITSSLIWNCVQSVLKIDVVHRDLNLSELGVVETLIDPVHKVGKLFEKWGSPGFVLIIRNWLETEESVADNLLIQSFELIFEADVFVEAIVIEQRE
jgi:hypothetical protein